MDGTLLNSKKQIPQEFKSWVLLHPQIKTVISSGRQYYALERDFKDIKDSLLFIAENGSLVFEKGNILFKDLMTKEDLISSLKLIEQIPYATPILCGVNSAFMKSTEDEELYHATMYYERLKHVESLYETVEKEEIVKLAIYFSGQRAEASNQYFSSLKEGLKSVVSGVSWIDVANGHANKGVALKAIMEKYHFKKEECMAFGDYFNDVEMLQEVKYSFAMENAHPFIKNICLYHTSSNDEDGVMKVLRDIDSY